MNGYEGVARFPPACVHKFFSIENYIYIYKFSPRIKKESLVRTDRSKFQFNIIPWERIRLIVLRGGKERGDTTPLSLFSFERSWNFVVNPSRDPAMTELSTRMDE